MVSKNVQHIFRSKKGTFRGTYMDCFRLSLHIRCWSTRNSRMATMRVPERAFSFALMTLARQLLLKTSYHSLTRISCSLHGSDQNMSHTRTKSSCLQLRNDKMFNVTSNTSTHFSTQRQLPRVYLFTKEGCTLCEEAKEVLKPIMHKVIIFKILLSRYTLYVIRSFLYDHSTLDLFTVKLQLSCSQLWNSQSLSMNNHNCQLQNSVKEKVYILWHPYYHWTWLLSWHCGSKMPKNYQVHLYFCRTFSKQWVAEFPCWWYFQRSDSHQHMSISIHLLLVYSFI